ncbi:putative acyl-CoA transferase/carnitine dehydratase [Syncephalastrum racemosum]|uniref:Putative acyl-CoA transferase/carnitine dehydratase n=1 Tax=Syncephalastrum racemosum TaxID=13706 RepID=A0A1X2H1S7_SYNRA|nr:putative acyl-CoA transferase/carnitine dehydratase [Syncephalastrum racemosum]
MLRLTTPVHLWKAHLVPLTRRCYTTDVAAKSPLEGVRVLELGQLIAGPFCGSILGYYGADVIKVEPPNNVGDPLRTWRYMDKDGTSPWFRSLGRNKKSVCIDLRTEKGRSIVKQLAEESDVLIENFKPGTMEKWGLGPDDLYAKNPKLIYTRISGYGQTGPYSKKPGFASVCEGMGGFRYVNGHPGQAPVRPNLSLGDSLAGMHAALGVLLGLIARNKVPKQESGQVVDVAIYESVLNMMESIVPEYDRAGMVRQPAGTTVTGVVPTNTYPCKNGDYVIIGGNGDSIYKRLMVAIGREDLTGPKYETNTHRVAAQEEIDGAIGEWTSKHTPDEVLDTLASVSVPAGKIYSAQDIVEDEHINARGMIETIQVGTKEEGRGWDVKMPGMSPVLHSTPGKTRWAGPDLGEHTYDILGNYLGLSRSELEKLSSEGVISGKK